MLYESLLDNNIMGYVVDVPHVTHAYLKEMELFILDEWDLAHPCQCLDCFMLRCSVW